jgi:hypothetical protein
MSESSFGLAGKSEAADMVAEKASLSTAERLCSKGVAVDRSFNLLL